MAKDVPNAKTNLIASLNTEGTGLGYNIIVISAVIADHILGSDVCDWAITILGGAYVFVCSSVFSIQ